MRLVEFIKRSMCRDRCDDLANVADPVDGHCGGVHGDEPLKTQPILRPGVYDAMRVAGLDPATYRPKYTVSNRTSPREPISR